MPVSAYAFRFIYIRRPGRSLFAAVDNAHACAMRRNRIILDYCSSTEICTFGALLHYTRPYMINY